VHRATLVSGVELNKTGRALLHGRILQTFVYSTLTAAAAYKGVVCGWPGRPRVFCFMPVSGIAVYFAAALSFLLICCGAHDDFQARDI